MSNGHPTAITVSTATHRRNPRRHARRPDVDGGRYSSRITQARPPLIFAADFFRANESTRHSTDPNEQRWAAGLRGELLLSHQDQSSLA
jgi:hypothetical protein